MTSYQRRMDLSILHVEKRKVWVSLSMNRCQTPTQSVKKKALKTQMVKDWSSA